jgi:hypothetical protein
VHACKAPIKTSNRSPAWSFLVLQSYDVGRDITNKESILMAAIELYEAMRTLRAVRRLRPDPIPDDVLRRVLEAATWAPTGGNRQAWRIIVVKDQMRKQRLGELYKKITIPFMQ